MTKTLQFEKQTKTLIDDLKSVCANYGLGNDGNEFKIITQVFLYKFLNDKFGKKPEILESNINALKAGYHYADTTEVFTSRYKVAKAKVEYQNCLNGNPDPTTAKYCQAVLAKLGAASAATGVASIPGSGTSASGSGSTMVAALGGDPLQTEAESAAEEKKQAIMSKAEKEIRAYRAEWNRRLEAGEIVGYPACGRLIKPDGTMVWDYHDSVRAIAEKQCEEVCDHMRYMAEQQCKFIK